jgi:hypothetical protein
MKAGSGRIRVVLALFLLTMTGYTYPQNQFRVGQSFPALQLPALEDGHPVSLSDFSGRKVILQIFASW